MAPSWHCCLRRVTVPRTVAIAKSCDKGHITLLRRFVYRIDALRER